ncbi:hypothetical protein DID88_008193 [Monilinia fructigena]|uniref:Chitinase n=1 Tax=Monilinia fructigena TaxID=38457 RepID=A0A395J5M9_9HELO|nr:hypothetical protein DID88_008193 [Monilinia fructigena]
MSYDLHGPWEANNPALGAFVRPQTSIPDITSAISPLVSLPIPSYHPPPSNTIQRLIPHTLSISPLLKPPQTPQNPNPINPTNPHPTPSGSLASTPRNSTLASPPTAAATPSPPPPATTSTVPTAPPVSPARAAPSPAFSACGEIEVLIQREGLRPTWVGAAAAGVGATGVKQIVYGGGMQWMGFDDEETWGVKRRFADALCIGGTVVWSLDLQGVGSGDGNFGPGF